MKFSHGSKKNIERFIHLIENFLPIEDGRDQKWVFFLKKGSRWNRISVTKYENVYYISGFNFDSFSYPAQEKLDPVIEQRLPSWIRELEQWRNAAARNPIEAQAQLLKRLPLYCRQGVIRRQNVRLLIPDWMPIASEFAPHEKKEILEFLRKPSAGPLRFMTLNKFFDYCRVAYQANPETFRKLGFRPRLSGREYYQLYADGRHGGLLDIKPDSSKAFEQWYQSKSWAGSHPWEIYRGGNSTHINMYVTQPIGQPKNWEVRLCAPSSTRMIETCRIALALAKAGLPVGIDEAESYINRILDQDWVGVVAEQEEILYGWQSFPQEWGVRDCVSLSWFYEKKSQPKRRLSRCIRALVQWLPEDVSASLKKKTLAHLPVKRHAH